MVLVLMSLIQPGTETVELVTAERMLTRLASNGLNLA